LAGGLGLNLLECRDAVVMQPGWNDVEFQQAIGRVIKFRSHINLPVEERRVDVWKLMLGAAEGGHRDLVDFFISKGANDWNLAMYYAALGGHRDLVDFFKRKMQTRQ